MKRIFFVAIATILLGIGCSTYKQPPKTAEQLEAELFLIEPNDLIVHTQPVGSTVIISETKFAKPGFLSIHEVNDDLTVGTVLGYSRIIPAGIQQNQKIALTVELVPEKKYIAELFDDTDGDTLFILKKDKPLYRPGSDKVIQKTFTVQKSL